MAGKERSGYAQVQEPKDERGFDEKLLGLGKWSNKITLPLGAAVTVGATVLGFPIVAAGALAGMGVDYMAGESTDEMRKERESRRLRRTAEGNGAKMTSFKNPERAQAIDAKLRANQGSIFTLKR